ncbi:hypothetical protein NP233_g8614 [Leucocoprinus birnbaumii]|uniref:F-box domain-containing protein n=1 Tax=Leucocoprinus birnbaumii TaxID=56174 RepID=A0AAD5VM04_9AGAR|nr:hypothetical protein NP233_g8614 [Leucocoprinus birnbaumii]
MDNLAAELLQEVISHLADDSNALCSLCLCSKRLLPHSLEILYKTITITDLDSEGTPFGTRLDLRRGSQFFITLARLNQSLTRHVRRLHFAPSGLSFWSMADPDRPNLLENLTQSLKLMVNLKVLTVHFWGHGLTTSILRGCSFPQLESFSTSHSDMNRDVKHPLHQSNLKQFRIRVPRHGMPLYEVESSQLMLLGGDARTIMTVLPRAPSVTSLLWKRNDNDSFTLTPALIHGFTNLSSLCIESLYYWDIKALAPHLQSLRVLHFTRDGECFINFVAELADVLLLRGLQTFIYSDQNKYKIGYVSMSEKMSGIKGSSTCLLGRRVSVSPVPMHDLLPELLYEVVSHLKDDRPALCNLSRCSKRLLLACRQTLYRDILFTDLDSEGPPHLLRTTSPKLIAVLAQSHASIAHHVRRFHFAPSDVLWSLLKLNAPNFREDLIASLKLMVNLGHLTIEGWGAQFGFPNWKNVIEGCTFQLEYLCAIFDAVDQRGRIPELVPNQSQLRQLHLWVPEPVSFPQTQSSQLTVLGGDTRTIETVLPDTTKVTSLLWERTTPDPISITTTLIQRFEDLDTLCIESSYYWDIKALAPYLQNLQVLHFTRDQERTFVNFESEFVDVPQLRELRKFIYSDQHKYKLGYTCMVEQARIRNIDASKFKAKALVQEWFRQLPHFQAAYFQVANAVRVKKSFVVWERRKVCYDMVEGSAIWEISPWG